MKNREIELLIDALSSLPSISKKTAEKITYFIIDQDDVYVNQLTRRISDIKSNIKMCKDCNNITINTELCSRCCSNSINKHELVIVTNFQDVDKIEAAFNEEKLFFVLLSEINYRKRDSKQVDEKYSMLKKMIEKNKVNEILIATDLTINGELTANYLTNLIKRDYQEIKVFRPATGMPLNSSIDYIDIDSLKYSIKNKTKM